MTCSLPLFINALLTVEEKLNVVLLGKFLSSTFGFDVLVYLVPTTLVLRLVSKIVLNGELTL